MIKVGFVWDGHGINKEFLRSPPKGVKYEIINHSNRLNGIYENLYDLKDYHETDLIETIHHPLISNQNYVTQMSSPINVISIFGLDLSRAQRVEIWKKLILRKNCKRLLFRSKAGINSLGESYANIQDKAVYDKVELVYPAFRQIPDIPKKENKKLNILFIASAFYQKAGEPLIDAFLRLEKKYDIQLTIFSNLFQKWYFPSNTYSSKNHNQILKKIKTNNNIQCYPVTEREKLLGEFFPKADIFAMPTLKEAFGYSLVEAMSFGIPSIATDIYAIPEIITHNKEGFLINIKDSNFVKDNLVYDPNKKIIMPERFQNYMEEKIYNKLKLLIEDSSLRKKMGRKARKKARTKFSLKKRNKIMKNIYEEAI